MPTNHWHRTCVIGTATLALALGCAGKSKDTKGGHYTLTAAPEITATVNIADPIQRHFELMDGSDVDAALERSLRDLRSRDGIVNELVTLYEKLASDTSGGDYGVAWRGSLRWRIVQLLGRLGNPRAVAPLHMIARSPLPAPKRSEEVFKVEYRVRLRAIAGLEKLRAVDELSELYKNGGLLKGAAAASLFELGKAPRGVKALDVNKVMGPGDSSDYKVSKRDQPASRTSPVPPKSTTDDATIVPNTRKEVAR